MPVLENPLMQAVFEYSDATYFKAAELTIRYGGKQFDITDSDDDLAVTLCAWNIM